MAGLPNSRETLKQWCLKRLGKPVISINVDDEQLEDRIDEALRYYREFHVDGTRRSYVPHQITSTDVSQEYIAISDIDSSIDTVLDLMPLNVGQNSTNFFSFEYQFRLNDMHSLINLPVQDYYIVQQHLKMFEILFTGKVPFSYNRNEKKLYIHQDWGTRLEVGDWIVADAVVIIDPSTYGSVFSDPWILDYTYQLFKMQWGNNLLLHSNIPMLGGHVLDGAKLYADAQASVEELQKKLRDTYEKPVGFYCG